MDDGLKQRLIGAFVLLALAVIFIPVFFDRERMAPVDKVSQIPPSPTPEVMPETQVAERPKVDNPAPENSEDMFVPNEKTVVKIEKVKAAPAKITKEENVPQSWILQIASYTQASQAKDMRDKLSVQGYTAYVKTLKTSQGERTRLYVGPKLDKNALEKDQKEIEEKYKLKTMMLKFEP